MSIFLTIGLVVFLSRFSRLECLQCYLCNSYDRQSQDSNGWNESCNVLTLGEQWETCPKLGTYCFSICSEDTVRNLRYIRRGCTSRKYLCARFNKREPGIQIECSVCSHNDCNHMNACHPEWNDYDKANAKGNTSTINYFTKNTKVSDTNETTSIVYTSSEKNLSRTRIILVTDYPGQIIDTDYVNDSYDGTDFFSRADFPPEKNYTAASQLKIRSLELLVLNIFVIFVINSIANLS